MNSPINTPTQVSPAPRHGGSMYFMPAGHLNRSPDRRVAVAFRLSIEDRAELQQMARREGVSVQTYLERIVFGRTTATDRPHGPIRQKALPLDDEQEGAA